MSKQIQAIPKFTDESQERACRETHDATEQMDLLKVAAKTRDVPWQSLIKVCLQEKLHAH